MSVVLSETSVANQTDSTAEKLQSQKSVRQLFCIVFYLVTTGEHTELEYTVCIRLFQNKLTKITEEFVSREHMATKKPVNIIFVGDKGSGKNYLLDTYATRKGGEEEEKAVGIVFEQGCYTSASVHTRMLILSNFMFFYSV